MNGEPSHEFSFDDNDYARPNQPWRCGWADDGHACPLGPTKWGLCRSAHECAPYQEGDTWVCARTQANGGPCDEGPLPDGSCCRAIQPCQPKRSVMVRRGIVSFCSFALAVGVGLVMLGSANRTTFVSPGELSSPHKQNVRHKQVFRGCQDCHDVGEGTLSDWVHSAFNEDAANRQSQLCLTCHQELGPNSLHPHSVGPEVLTALRDGNERRASDSSGSLSTEAARRLLAKAVDPHDNLACATCHREHQGDAALTDLTNQQCHVCHADAFDSFAGGHPEFVHYPHERRTPIYFDHASHYGQHFVDSLLTAGKTRSHSCGECHVQDTAGRYMLVRRFETSCASCHEHQITDDTMPGLPVVAIPAIDLDSLRAKSMDIGEWPATYPMHVEASASMLPVADLLLSGADGYAELRASLVGLDLSDLRDATPEQLSSVASLAWRFKEMLYDITRLGQPDIKRRLRAALLDDDSQQQYAVLADLLPVELLARMQERWLPHLAEEIESRREGTDLAKYEEAKPVDVAQAILSERRRTSRITSGWYLDGPTLSLRYRPVGHADPLLKTLLEISVGSLSHSEETAGRQPLRALHDQLSSPFATGRCTKCHSIDNAPQAAPLINWFPYEPPLESHAFTRFSHAPHMTLLKDSGCSHCHEITSAAASHESLLQPIYFDPSGRPATDATQFDSGFSPLEKARCADCHDAKSTRDRCLTCHNYHVR